MQVGGVEAVACRVQKAKTLEFGKMKNKNKKFYFIRRPNLFAVNLR